MKRTVLAVAIATILALVGCAMILIYVRGADARAVAGKDPTYVVIALKTIPAGTLGSVVKDTASGYVDTVTMPKSTVPDTAYESTDDIPDDLVLTADVQEQQLLMNKMFGVATEASAGLQIPDTMVALSVPLPTQSGLTYISPGSEIAIYDTFNPRANEYVPDGSGFTSAAGINHVTRLLLPRAKVIAIGLATQTTTTTEQTDTEVVASEDEEAATDTTTVVEGNTIVTLALTQSEAERMILAMETGKLYVVLINDNSAITTGPGVNYDSLFQ